MKTELEQLEQLLATLLKYQTKLNVTYDQLNHLAIELIKEGYGNISEYKAEIERLKAKNKVLGNGVAKAFTNGFNTGREQVEKDIRRAKINILRELRERITKDRVANDTVVINANYEIGELIKEVENDEEDIPHSQTLVESLNAETKELMLSLYCKKMQRAVKQQYLEDAHVTADSVLCELLTLLGYDKVVEIYNTLPKMYS